MKNRFGIEVLPCCASCGRRLINIEGRQCSLNGNPVAASDCCDHWEMEKGLQNAGRGGGKVKKCHYLVFYMERWLEQRHAYESGEISAAELRSDEDIRKEYEEEHGSIYINI